MEFITFLYIVIGVALVLSLASYIHGWVTHPYRWACMHEGCSFKIRTNDEVILSQVSMDHMYHFHTRRKDQR